VIQPGKRAYSIALPRNARIQFGIHPNDHVDVLSSVDEPNVTGLRRWGILVSDLRVLALAPRVQVTRDAGAPDEMVVALEVTPGQAEAIATAGTRSTLDLQVRRSDATR
jgi:Flp pilus assembly protein CpaB